MESKRTHYDVLRVRQDATREHIEDRYKRERASNHPDKYPNATSAERAQLEANFREIEQAYAVLSNARSRSDYDRGLRDAAAADARASSSSPGATGKSTDSGHHFESDPDEDDEAAYQQIRAWVIRQRFPFLIRTITWTIDVSNEQALRIVQRLIREGVVSPFKNRKDRYRFNGHAAENQRHPGTADGATVAEEPPIDEPAPSFRQRLINRLYGLITLLAVISALVWVGSKTSDQLQSDPSAASTPATPSITMVNPPPAPAQPINRNPDSHSMPPDRDTTTEPTSPGTVDPNQWDRQSTIGESKPDREIDLGRISPVYPATALREGHEGTVTLEVAVDADGHVTDVRLLHSSGYRELDQAAIDAIPSNAKPQLRNGVPVAGVITVPVDYRLDGG